jgi:hypothetical protein
MDTAHNVLDNVEVFIRQPKRQARTNVRGTFALGDLEPGTYELIVRRIGYELALQKYIVTDSGGVARFCLQSEAQGLAAMITSVPRGGLSGVVGDTTYAVVPGAEVRLLGDGKWAITDSAGGFFIPVEKGIYPVMVSKKGYGPQVLSVRVPQDSGRKIAVWLGAPGRNPNTFKLHIEDMRQRILRTPAHRYRQVTSEDLASSELSLVQLVRVAGRGPADDDCEAFVAGTRMQLPLYMFDKNDIAMMEIVGGPIRAKAARCPQVIVWMKP